MGVTHLQGTSGPKYERKKCVILVLDFGNAFIR